MPQFLFLVKADKTLPKLLVYQLLQGGGVCFSCVLGALMMYDLQV